MGKQDWFRNKVWNPAIEVDFQQRLRRARNKSQYLRVQAYYLAESYPQVTLDLLDQYFALGDRTDLALALVHKARAHYALGDVNAAISSYEEALERERQFPHVKTHAYLEFVRLVIKVRAAHLYPRALEVLDFNRGLPMFPVDRYLANGARALLLHESGRTDEARSAADLAMAAAQEVESGFRYHKNLGLVENTDDEFGLRIAALANRTNH